VAGATPSAAAIEHARAVGRRRAADGIALPDVIEAYHIAYRKIWSEILADAQRTDPSLLNELTSQVSLLWLWFHRLSAAVAESHAAESQARHSNRLVLERDFLDQLLGRAAHDDAVAAVLGYRMGDPFIVACIAGLGQPDAEQVTEAYLVYTGVARLGRICPYCTSVHIITFILFSLIAFQVAVSDVRRCLLVESFEIGRTACGASPW
jgi:hypothetical protein